VDTTDGSGYYEFSVAPGTYTVTEVLKAGWTQTYPEIPGDGDWDVTLTSGQEDLDNNFGNFANLNVTACKKYDEDGNLATTDDQTPIAGWTVYLTVNGTREDTQVTGENGCYTWENLGPIPGGYYDVEEDEADFPAGWYNLTALSHDFESPPQSGASYNFTFVNSEFREEGCTPGFWKTHPDLWHGYDTDELIGDVFIIPAELSDLADDTLMDALNYDGGDGAIGMARNLLRAAVAAILNAADPDVNYAIGDPQDIIDMVDTALASLDRDEMETLKDDLDDYNNAGCPIDAHGDPVVPEEEEEEVEIDSTSESPSSNSFFGFFERLFDWFRSLFGR
jgi:hypothetical protein